MKIEDRKIFLKWKILSQKFHSRNVHHWAICKFRITSKYRWVQRHHSIVQYKGKSSRNISSSSSLIKINFPSIFFHFGFQSTIREHLSLSLMTPRTRRFSCSSNSNGPNSGLVSPGPRLAPRISQLRQEECVDVQNREATHEREVHSAISISQSYEDLTLVLTENCSFKNSDEFSNPLHVVLPNSNVCSSPSPNR